MERLTGLVLGVALLPGCAGVQDSLYETALRFERWRSELVERRVGHGDETIAYVERLGQGDTSDETIVLLHGFAGHKDLWLQFTRHLPTRYRVLAIDLPGHGGSAQSLAFSYGPSDLTARFARTVERLGLESFHLGGNSLGGLVATLYAIEHPDRVNTLALFAPAGVYPPTPSELQQRLERGDNPLLVETREEFDRLMEFVFVEPPWMPWPVRPVLSRQYIRRAPVNAKIWADLVAGFEDVRARLRRVRAPTFLLWGEADRVLHVSSLAVYTERLAQAEAHIIANSGHIPMVEHVRETTTRYSRFLDKHARHR